MELRRDCTYSAVELLLNAQFKVHHLYRDYRGDWGDDSGYIVAIVEDIQGNIYLEVIFISYNGEVGNLVLHPTDEIRLSENWYDKEQSHREYFECENILCAQNKLNKLLDMLNHMLEVDDDFHWGSAEMDEVKEEFPNITKDEFFAIATMSFPYSEYPQDEINLRQLITIPYTPDYTNEYEEE